jgi:hypothetical protein
MWDMITSYLKGDNLLYNPNLEGYYIFNYVNII